jgi:hypothetical protein
MSEKPDETLKEIPTQKKRSALFWMDYVVRRPSQNFAVVKALPRVSITSGRRSFLRLASVGLLVIRLVRPLQVRFQSFVVRRVS